MVELHLASSKDATSPSDSSGPDDASPGTTDVGALRAEVSQLRAALSSRAAIDQAQGMLMARYGVDAARAFEILKHMSSLQNVKVRVIAEEMVSRAEHGELSGYLPSTLPERPPAAGGPDGDLR